MMLTPQEVSEHAFSKASFGGYNMGMVDEWSSWGAGAEIPARLLKNSVSRLHKSRAWVTKLMVASCAELETAPEGGLYAELQEMIAKSAEDEVEEPTEPTRRIDFDHLAAPR